jgi:hemerythrin-like domain-containing protein
MEHDFIQHLKEDHEKQRSMAKRLANSSGSGEREDLRNEFYEELYPHMVGEESSIFDFMTSVEDEDARAGALEALQEHHVAKMVLRELMELSLDSDIFRAKAKVLMELNNHHLEEEEEEHFPTLERLCSKEQLDELFKAYEDAEEGAKDS